MWPDWTDDFRIPTVGDSVRVDSAHVLTIQATRMAPQELRVAVQPKSESGVLSPRAQAVATLIRRVHADTRRFLQRHIDVGANGGPPDDLPVDLKNILENYRSALEYVAHYMAAACSPVPSENNVQFPIAAERDTKESFAKKLDGWFPRLAESAPEARDYIISIQPFASDPWLRELADLTNQSKHRILAPHTLGEFESLVIRVGSAGLRFGELGLRQLSIFPNAVLRFEVPGEQFVRIPGPALLAPYIRAIPNADHRIELVRERRTLYRTERITGSIASKVWEISRGVVRAIDSICNALSKALPDPAAV